MDYKKIKSYKDACRALGLKPISDEVFNAFGQDAKTVAAYHKLAVITRAINEGWQPDWSDRNDPKFEPYMYTNSAGLACANANIAPSYTHSDTIFGSRLCFPDYERATFAVKTFGELYKDYFRPEDYTDKEQEAAEEEKPNTESESGDVEKHIEDLSDAPDFLKKVGEITTGQIIPLLEQDRENRAVILITAQDNTEDKDGDKGFAVTFGVVGVHNVLAQALASFFQHKKSKEIVKSAQLRVKLDSILKDFISN